MHADTQVDVEHWIDGRGIQRRQWLLMGLCFAVVLFDGIDVAAMGFIAPALLQDWGLSKPALGPVMSAAMVGLALGALLSGPLADRFGRKTVLTCAVALFGAASVCCAYAGGPYQLALLRFVTGIGLGAAMPNTTTLVSEYMPARQRSFLITIMFTGFNLGSGAGGFLAAWLIPQHGWRSVLLAGGVLPLALLPLLALFLPESARFLVIRSAPAARIARILRQLGGNFSEHTRFVAREQKAAERTPLSLLFTPGSRRVTFSLWTTYFMGLCVIYLIMSWLPLLIRESGAPIEQAASVAAMFQLGGAVGAIVVGFIMDRREPSLVIAAAYAVGGVLIALLGVLGLESALLGAGVTLAGFCMSGAQTGLNAFAPGCYPTQARATGVSWMLGIGRFGAILGSAIGGAVLSLGLGFGALFVVLAIPAVVAALAIMGQGVAARRPARPLEA